MGQMATSLPLFVHFSPGPAMQIHPVGKHLLASDDFQALILLAPMGFQ